MQNHDKHHNKIFCQTAFIALKTAISCNLYARTKFELHGSRKKLYVLLWSCGVNDKR